MCARTWSASRSRGTPNLRCALARDPVAALAVHLTSDVRSHVVRKLLLRLCLVASITYQMRRLLWEKQRKEPSELKCAYMVQIYLKKYTPHSFTP